MKAQNSKSRRILALITMLFGAMITMSLSAYGQQEVSPSWYDPWGTENAAVAQAAKPAVAAHKQARTMKSASMTSSAKPASRVRRAEKLHAKRSISRPTAS
jgi:hypothetical protein